MKTISAKELESSKKTPGNGWYIIEAAGVFPKQLAEDVTVTENLAPEVLAAVAEEGVPEEGLFIDLEHESCNGGSTAARGWVKELALCGDDLAAGRNTQTTPRRVCSTGESHLFRHEKAAQEHPKSADKRPAESLDYALKRREMLESWLYAPNIPIDNNAAERAVRPVTIGRKNCLFIGAPEAGQRSAILYTMMEECKRCKVDSLAWLTWVLNRLPNYRGDYRDLYPSAMPKPQEQVKERTI